MDRTKFTSKLKAIWYILLGYGVIYKVSLVVNKNSVLNGEFGDDLCIKGRDTIIPLGKKMLLLSSQFIVEDYLEDGNH